MTSLNRLQETCEIVRIVAMNKRDLIQRLEKFEGVSGGEDVYLKSPDGGQWGELTLRRATNDEKRRSGIKPDKWIAVIAVEGNSKLTLQALVDQLRLLPEIADVYTMHYPNAGTEWLADIDVLGLKSLHEEGCARNVIALSAQETPHRNTGEKC
jgi:hypothetical protein